MNIKYVTLETNILLHVKPETNKNTVGGEKNRFFQNAWIFVSGWVWLEFKEKKSISMQNLTELSLNMMMKIKFN